ncbi:uncharacterized protein FA14DRAFT_7393 [Meira miltonrushii]|uniref:Uncharacterized protein n=1 Tax=Meira miltonrushii TaxID=1280837 RepID=A0A316VGY2_9BASI|nr:uncharacterized protein FA14DRAFT_7393 [Meira miltonrushii]PWN36852.1 hypothetical protein FA14DRAFT_7393 [Meira miltonrushii]
MGLLSRLKSLDGFSQKPLQEKDANTGTRSNKSIQTTSTQSSNEGVRITGRSSRRGSETAKSISSSITGQNHNSPRPKSVIPKAQTDQTVKHHTRKRSLTNPNVPTQNLLPQSNKIESGLPLPLKGNQTRSYEEYKQSLTYESAPQFSMHLHRNQRKESNGSIPSLNATGTTSGTPSSMIEGEVVESSTFPTSGSLITSSLRSTDLDSPRLFSGSWHSPNPGAQANNGTTMDYDDEGMAEEIVEDTQQSSNDTFYAKTTLDHNAESSSYSTDVDSISQSNLNKANLGTHTLRKASSRFKSGFMRSPKRPSTADASMVHRKPTSWDSVRRRESHSICQSSEDKSVDSGGLRVGVPRKSIDSITSTFSIGSRNTMTRSTTLAPPQAAVESKLPLPNQEMSKDEHPSPTAPPPRQRVRASSITSSHSVKAVIRATLSRPTSRGGSQNNHESSSPLVSPKSQNVEFVPQNNGQTYSPALNSPSPPSQQQSRSIQMRQKQLADQAGSFKGEQERIILRNPGFEKSSLTPAPRKRSKSRTYKNSNEFDKSFERAEPVPEIPSQYRDERRSSIATTFYSEDHANESIPSSEECDSIDHTSSNNDDFPGFRTSISTSTTSAQQHTPQSSISGSSSMAQSNPNEKQVGGVRESLMPRTSSFTHTQQDGSERSLHPPTTWKTQAIDTKFQLLTPESFSSSRSRLREIQNLSSGALRIHSA